MKKAVFFDRDDTLIKDIPYNGDPDRVELLPEAQRVCRLLKQHGFELIIISNQSGVGRGLITKDQVNAVNDRLVELLGPDLLTAIYCCFDTPEDVMECRKPSPKMLQQAAKDHDIDLAHSFMVGDKFSDVLAGKNAGCRTVYLSSSRRETSAQTAQEAADFTASTLSSAAEWIIQTLK